MQTLRQAQSDKINEDFVGVLLETAHPAKFVEVVEDVLKEQIEIPEKLEAFNKREKKSALKARDNAFPTEILSISRIA